MGLPVAGEEADERNREIAPGDEMRYWQALRPDYHPIVEMYLISGRRRSDRVELRARRSTSITAP